MSHYSFYDEIFLFFSLFFYFLKFYFVLFGGGGGRGRGQIQTDRERDGIKMHDMNGTKNKQN